MSSHDERSARAIAAAVRDGSTTATAVVEACLERIAERDRELGAFVEVWDADARAQAAAVDAARAAGRPLGPLAGVPVALKDNFVRRGFIATCASRILDGYSSPFDATVVERLTAAGAVLVGRTNMDEFAMGSSTERSAHGLVRNPWDHERVPGGSSGGSAVAVAAGMVPLALGSDTGGSVRQPAALCGTSGLKPTYGRISRFGLVAFASSLDHVAPFGRDAVDLALLLGVLAGVDANDPTSLDAPLEDYVARAESGEGADRADVRVGVPRRLLATATADGALAADVLAAFEASLTTLEDRGARIVDVELPHVAWAIPAYYLLCSAEASSNLARFDGVRYGRRVEPESGGEADLDAMYRSTRGAGFGEEVKMRILLGTFALQSGYADRYYRRATQVRTLIRGDYERAFGSCDVVATPTTPSTAFRIGELVDDRLKMYAADSLTVPPSLAGLPALSIPNGAGDTGLPIGLQLVGAALDEGRLLETAGALQAWTDHHRREPSA